MEPHKIETTKLNGMVMCGDHPSFTKTELNAKEEPGERDRERQKDKGEIKFAGLYGKITPTASRLGVGPEIRGEGRGEGREEGRVESRGATARVLSEHALAAGTRVALTTRPHTNILQAAALGSFRWPPYLLCVWVLLLVLGHVLHCLVGVLERTLPHIRKFCHYFRTWTEESWKTDVNMNQRAGPVALACVTGFMYSLYCAIYVLYAIALWAVEPLCEIDEKASLEDIPKITNYVDESNNHINTSVK